MEQENNLNGESTKKSNPAIQNAISKNKEMLEKDLSETKVQMTEIDALLDEVKVSKTMTIKQLKVQIERDEKLIKLLNDKLNEEKASHTTNIKREAKIKIRQIKKAEEDIGAYVTQMQEFLEENFSYSRRNE